MKRRTPPQFSARSQTALGALISLIRRSEFPSFSILRQKTGRVRLKRRPTVLRKRLLFVTSLLIVAAAGLLTNDQLRGWLVRSVSADLSPQTLPFSQDWTNTGLITTDGNWAGVPGIIGYRGDDLTTATGT